MEKEGKSSYPSEKPIGKMYQRCLSITCDAVVRSAELRLDERLVLPGHEEYLPQARAAHRR